MHRTVCRGGAERESVTGSAVLHRTEVLRTGSQLECSDDMKFYGTSAVLFVLSIVVGSEPDELLTYG